MRHAVLVLELEGIMGCVNTTPDLHWIQMCLGKEGRVCMEDDSDPEFRVPLHVFQLMTEEE